MNVNVQFDLARALVTAIQHLRLYGADHRTTAASFEDLFVAVRRLLPAAGSITIETAALSPEHQHAAALAAHLNARSIKAITLRPEANRSDLETLVRLLALEPEELIAEGGLADALRQSGTRAIEAREGGAAREALPRREVDPVYGAALILDQQMAEAARGQPVDAARARRSIDDLADAFTKNPVAIWSAIANRRHDELDPMHGVSTAVMTIAVADALEVSNDGRIDLGAAALLHDIGMAALSPAARARERTVEGAQDSWRHPAEGGYLLRDAEDGGTLAMIVAMEHHLPSLQRLDASPPSRLIGLADYVDAVTAARVSGLRRQTMDGVLARLLAGEGPSFDPVHVRLLAAVIHDAAVAGVDFWRA